MVCIENSNIAVKRTFSEIRGLILHSLAKGQKTINQISVETEINWKTVENHLVHLAGKMLVREAFTSQFVRIFELTAFGKDHLRNNSNGNIHITDNKLIKIGGGHP